MEGLSSLLFAQKVGQVGKELADEAESYQFGILIASAAAYVVAAWWIVVVSCPCALLLLSLIFAHIGVSSCSHVATLFYTIGCSIDRFPVSDGDWIPPPPDEHRRIFDALVVPGL